MGLGRLFNRSTQYVATDTTTGLSETFTIADNLAPDWAHGAYQGGMSTPGASRAALLLADLLGSIPWDAYRQRAGEPVEKLAPPPMLEMPDPPEPRVVTMTAWALDLIWHGNAVGVVADRNRDGWPTAFVPVPAEYVQVRRNPHGDPAFPVGEIVYEIGNRRYAHSEVFHAKGPCRPGALRGMGVLENHLRGALQLAEEQARQARALSDSGVPTGLLKVDDPDFEEADAHALRADWMRTQRNRQVAVLSQTTTFEPLSWNPSETQLLDARKFSLHELALVFGLDPSWLGVAGSSMTYQNTETKAIELLKFSLAGHLARFEQEFARHLPRGTWAEANLDAVLRADTLTRYQAHQIGVQNGFLTQDEVRAMERRPPLTPAQRAALRPPPTAQTPAPAGQAPTADEEADDA